MATKIYYIDGRVCVPGTRNPFLNLANPKELNDIIYQVIYGTAPNAPTGPLLIQNGLNSYHTTQNHVVELGGFLTRDTSILGAGTFGMSIIDMLNIVMSGEDVSIQAGNTFNLNTPNIGAASNGWVLTLINQLTGEAEWQAAPPAGVTDNIYIADGTLPEHRTLTGNGWNLQFFGLDSFNTTGDFCTFTYAESLLLRAGTGNAELTSTGADALLQATTGEASVIGNTGMYIKTPANFGATATAGDILFLEPSGGGTGKCEWGKLKYTQTFVIADWVAGVLTIPAATHGKGLEPMVQVFRLVGGNYEVTQRGDLVTLKIVVLPSGDVEVHRTGADYDGKIILI